MLAIHKKIVILHRKSSIADAIALRISFTRNKKNITMDKRGDIIAKVKSYKFKSKGGTIGKQCRHK